jgi:hypothetical protein
VCTHCLHPVEGAESSFSSFNAREGGIKGSAPSHQLKVKEKDSYEALHHGHEHLHQAWKTKQEAA